MLSISSNSGSSGLTARAGIVSLAVCAAPARAVQKNKLKIASIFMISRFLSEYRFVSERGWFSVTRFKSSNCAIRVYRRRLAKHFINTSLRIDEHRQAIRRETYLVSDFSLDSVGSPLLAFLNSLTP